MSENAKLDPDALRIVITNPAAWNRWLSQPPTPPERRVEWCAVRKEPKPS